MEGIDLYFAYICVMRRLILPFVLLALTAIPGNAYTDHRGHNLDSLERVVARWTPRRR